MPGMPCRMRLYNPKGMVITSFKMAEAPPPPNRAHHEQRVVMRESIPRHLSAQLPPGTIIYNANVTDVTADNKGKSAHMRVQMQVLQLHGSQLETLLACHRCHGDARGRQGVPWQVCDRGRRRAQQDGC